MDHRCSETEIIAMVTEAEKTYFTDLNGIDGLLANAGIAGTGAAHETSLEDWDRLIKVNRCFNWQMVVVKRNM